MTEELQETLNGTQDSRPNEPNAAPASETAPAAANGAANGAAGGGDDHSEPDTDGEEEEAQPVARRGDYQVIEGEELDDDAGMLC